MGMKIVAIRIGDRYGLEYEKYLEDKLSDYEFIWIKENLLEMMCYYNGIKCI